MAQTKDTAPQTTLRINNPEWNRLIEVWKSENKPTFLVVGGVHYRVNMPSDNEKDVSFTPFGGIDGQYGSITHIPGATR